MKWSYYEKYTIIRDLHCNFIGCKSFLESNSPDIVALCETNLNDLFDSSNFCVRCNLPLTWKDSVSNIHGFAFYVREDFLLHGTYLFFFLYRSLCSALCKVFDAISS